MREGYWSGLTTTFIRRRRFLAATAGGAAGAAVLAACGGGKSSSNSSSAGSANGVVTRPVDSANPDAPILSVTAPDAKTIVVKLKQPLSYVLAMLAYTVGGSFAIVPKETDTTLDVRRDILGTGPYQLEKYEASVGFTYKRFEN